MNMTHLQIIDLFEWLFQVNCCAKKDPKNTKIIPGWWYTYPSEKHEFVSWDDEIPNI